jgi:glycosyltransferase involved in cell wall biosynthesis
VRVSVVIPTYNRRHLIGGAIDSALSQVDVDVEINRG